MISSQKTLREKGECHIIFLKVWTFPKDTVKAKALVIWIPQKISFLYYGEVLKTAIIGFLIYISWPVSTSVYLCSTFTYKIFRGRIGLYLMEALLYFLYCAPFSKHAVGTWIKFSPHACHVWRISNCYWVRKQPTHYGYPNYDILIFLISNILKFDMWN